MRPPPRGFRDTHQQAAIGAAADIGGDAAFQRHAQFFPPIGAKIGLPIEIRRIGRAIHHHARATAPAQQGGEHADQPFVNAGHGGGQRAAWFRWRQGFGNHSAANTIADAAIGDQQAGSVQKPSLGIG